MRARSVSSHPDCADIISLIDVLPHANPSFFHVEVLGRIGSIVADSYIVTIPSGIARFGHGPCCCRSNGSAYRCGKVCPQMGFYTNVIGNAKFGVIA